MFNKRQRIYCNSEISMVHGKRKVLNWRLMKLALDLCTTF